MVFQETIGVCPKCRMPGFHKNPGFHLFGINNFHCDNCQWDFSEPIINNIRTSSSVNDSTYRNKNKSNKNRVPHKKHHGTWYRDI